MISFATARMEIWLSNNEYRYIVAIIGSATIKNLQSLNFSYKLIKVTSFRCFFTA